MNSRRMLFIANVACCSLPAQADASVRACLWVRHETDSEKGLLPMTSNHPWNGSHPPLPMQERVHTVHLRSPLALAAQTFYFNIQADSYRTRMLWMRMTQTHGFSHGSDNSFRYDPARWETKIYLPNPDGSYFDFTEQDATGKLQARYSEGFPLGQVGPDPVASSSMKIKVTIRPKTAPAPHSGLCISLWSPSLFGFPDSATATLVYR